MTVKNAPKRKKTVFSSLYEKQEAPHRQANYQEAPFATPQAPGEHKNNVRLNATVNGKWRCSIGVDNGADAIIIDSRTIRELAKFGSACVTKPHLRPQTFTMAASLPYGNPVSLFCTQSATMYVELRIRYCTALILRGVQWLVTKQEVGESLLRRPLLESLGLHTRDILAAAAE